MHTSLITYEVIEKQIILTNKLYIYQENNRHVLGKIMFYEKKKCFQDGGECIRATHYLNRRTSTFCKGPSVSNEIHVGSTASTVYIPSYVRPFFTAVLNRKKELLLQM